MNTQSIFISGGASGIGLVTGKLFSERGWRVGIGDLDSAALSLAAHAAKLEAFELDVRDPAAWEQVLDRFCGGTGAGLDVLVNNAGVLTYGWFDEQPSSSFEQSIDVNIKGVLYGARAGIERLKQLPGACLVNMASAAGLNATPKQAVYSATKFAVRGLSEALDIEFMRFGVRVACIEPFLVDTPMLDHEDPRGRSYRAVMQGQAILSPEDVAETVWRAVHGDALHYAIGVEPPAIVEHLAAEVDERRNYWRKLLKL